MPVICTGGFQTASVIRKAITDGDCDAVSMARPLVANNDLVKQFAAGRDRAPKPCTYCNKCLVHVVEHPLGCYEESRFASREEMLAQVMSVFQPAAVRMTSDRRSHRCAGAGGASCVVAAARRALGRSASIRPIGPSTYDDIVEHFKYGSIGSEPGVSLLRPVGGVLPPYWVFKALPSICRDKLPGGYASLGFVDGARPRSADRRLAAAAARHRSGRPELRRLPHRHRARLAAARRRASCSACRRISSICSASWSSSSTARSTTA